MVDWTDGIYQQIVEDRDREKEERNSAQILAFLEGKQWSDRARYARSRPVVDKFSRHFWESVGLLTDLALDFQVKLFDKLSDFSEFEALLNKLAVHWASRNNFEDRLYDVVLYGLLHTGYCKLQWLSSLNGGLGDVAMVPIAPWNCGMLGTDASIDDAEVFCTWRPVTLERLIRDFGDSARRVQSDPAHSSSFGGTSDSLRPSHISRERWQRLGGPLKQAIARRYANLGESSTTPYSQCALLKEFWLKDDSTNDSSETVVVGPQTPSGEPAYNWCYRVEPGEPLYPRGRVITTASGHVLNDSPNPYWHARFPFADFRPFRVPWQVSGLSVTRPWRQMSTIMNRIYGGVLDMINSVLEPTLVAPKAAFPPADWDALDPGAAGGKIKYNNNSPRVPEFAKRSEIPGWVFSYLQEIEKEYGQSSGASAVAQAISKKQVPGSDSLEKIINSRSFPVRVQSRALTSFVRSIGSMGIANILQFYSAAHRVAVLGASGVSSSDFRPIYGHALPAGIKGEDFVRKFQFVIKPGSTLSVEKDMKIEMALTLSKMGILSARGLFRTLDANFDYERNKEELLEEAKIKILVGAAAAAATGKRSHK